MIFLPTPGALVANRFLLRRPIGKGGMGQVWEAHDRELDSACAIKFILDHLARDPDARSRLVREARAVARLRSPHVVTILGVGEHADAMYLAMELLEGETLATRLKRTRRLDGSTTLAIVDQVVQVLDRAHAHGIVHRDLKPDNIWLSSDTPPFIKVLDFGVAKSTLKTNERRTATGALMGTPHYMSPEQAAGDREVDHRSDLWALAVIAMECLTGRRPFESSGLGDLLMKIMQSRPPLAQELDPTLPPALNLWWQRALEHELEQRFQTASELAAGLRVALGITGAPTGASPFAETARGTWGVAPVPRVPTLVTNITPAPARALELVPESEPATELQPLDEALPAAERPSAPPAAPQHASAPPAVVPAAPPAALVDSTQVADAPPPLTEPMTVPPAPAASFPARNSDAGSVSALAQTARARVGGRRWPYVLAGSSIGLALLTITWWRLQEPPEPGGAHPAAPAVISERTPSGDVAANGDGTASGARTPSGEVRPGGESSVAHSLRQGVAGAAPVPGGAAPVLVPAVPQPSPAHRADPRPSAPEPVVAPVRVAPVLPAEAASSPVVKPQPRVTTASAPSATPSRESRSGDPPKAAPSGKSAAKPKARPTAKKPAAKAAPTKSTERRTDPSAADLQRRLGF